MTFKTTKMISNDKNVTAINMRANWTDTSKW